MTVTFEYTAQLRRAAGCSREELHLPDGATLTAALRSLAAEHTNEFQRQLLTEHDSLQPSLLVFRGDHQVAAGDDPALGDGETVTIMSPISGG